MLSPEGRSVSWNEGAGRIQGYEVSEIVGEHFSVFYADEDVERGLPGEELRVAAIEGRFEQEGLRARKDGTLFQAEVVITGLRDEAGPTPGLWYDENAVEDVGFMVTEAPPSKGERLFYCGGAPEKKGGLQIWPKER
jgi:PAS domain S-box-containing protein